MESHFDILNGMLTKTFSKSSFFSMPVTLSLIAINTLIFMLMTIDAGFAPTYQKVIDWGGSIPKLTLSNQPWRSFTCMFVHIGFVHFAMNMYSLFFIGRFLEPLLGKGRLLIGFLCCGLLASLASLYWNIETFIVSAGASGAIFGLYGIFIAFLSTNLIPQKIRFGLLQNVLIFTAYNLLYGAMEKGIDNAAHIGGLLGGLSLGVVFVFLRKKLINVVVITSVLCTFFLSFQLLKNTDAYRFSVLLKSMIEDEEQIDLYGKQVNSVSTKQFLSWWDEHLESRLKNLDHSIEKIKSLVVKGKSKALQHFIIEGMELKSKMYHLMHKGAVEGTMQYLLEINEIQNKMRELERQYTLNQTKWLTFSHQTFHF